MPKSGPLENLISWLSGIGVEKGDSEDLRLQKALMVLCTILFIIAGVSWGIMYFLAGETEACWIPFTYATLSAASLLLFVKTRKIRVFRFSQLLLILLLPFALMVALGGFVNGSAVILWSLIAPLGAMLFERQRGAPKWLLAYVGLVLITMLAHPWLRGGNNLTTVQVNFFFTINLIAVGTLIFLMVYYFVGKKNFFQERAEGLLLNILPREIAQELKSKGSVAPRQFDNVSVLFADFKNFTQLVEKLDPVELVEELDSYFKAFDLITAKYGVEKIKTIGDAYMCAAGLPVPCDDHATTLVKAAFEMLEFTREHCAQRTQSGKMAFSIRIGIHSGPVVAGIVGVKKFAYDIWGDTVNIASRMESSGEADKINISGSTYNQVKDAYTCTYRGKIQARHKGEIDMWFVDGR